MPALATKEAMWDVLPDYGLDDTLVNLVGIEPTKGAELRAPVFLGQACSKLLVHAIDELDQTSQDRSTAFWQSSMSAVWMMRSDDMLAREALAAIAAGEGTFADAPLIFTSDAFALAAQLVRHQRKLFDNDSLTLAHEWVRDNPIANALSDTRHMSQEQMIDGLVALADPSTAIVNAQQMYVID